MCCRLAHLLTLGIVHWKLPIQADNSQNGQPLARAPPLHLGHHYCHLMGCVLCLESARSGKPVYTVKTKITLPRPLINLNSLPWRLPDPQLLVPPVAACRLAGEGF
jgi:hypothetical protein